MKRFLIALGVFCCWFFLGVLFMNTTGAVDQSSLFASKVVKPKDLDTTPGDTTPTEFVPFIEEDPRENDTNTVFQEADTFMVNNLSRGNEQLVEDLTRSIQEKKRELAEDLEKLRNVKKNTNATAVAPRTFDALFYPEFKHARFVVDQKATSFLSFVKQKLAADANLHIKVVGHTDYIGDKEDNYMLALDEAKKVREFLIKSLKLPDNQVSAYSSGETEPIYDRDSENRELNHRIEIYFE